MKTQFNITDIAWMGGFLTGDGCVGLYTTSRGYPLPLVNVVNTERELLKPFQKLFGGSIKRIHKKGLVMGYRKNHDTYAWEVSCRKALQACIVLVPFIKGKKKDKTFKIIDHYAKRKWVIVHNEKGKCLGTRIIDRRT